ncbi:MAG: rRNA pseudouridine synthase [Magnetococcales bacterium]|nr:rRNA pseudouridine synthase [Magnetococcales bacterium]MBF0149574.1 rRNA pseudouridine synthase [Magnetococcales bacterium]MBF0175168.1 rRNA pseudouridine synthase [Magnetococcales bacterium]MBF0346880.1 rRNA pseudouridine synthase [Magnetococcales bacterium]MBF0632086.1 rRNA pseudouridine synthase [Magnetococcales bacterium]
MAEPMRLQKWLAQAGLCSRREGERWIGSGRVAVNGQVVTQPGSLVAPGDRVMVDGHPIAAKKGNRRVIVALNKPPSVLCTRHDPEGRQTIFDLLKDIPERLIYVGRLDINSEGLVLCTDDGDLVHRLTHPSARIPRRYRVRVHGRISEATLKQLRQGVVLDDGPTGPLDIVVDRDTSANNWLTMTLHEGRNRIIRRIFDTLDMKVSRLIRVAFGPVALGELARGHWRYLSEWEGRQLLADPIPLSTPEPAGQPPPRPVRKPAPVHRNRGSVRQR